MSSIHLMSPSMVLSCLILMTLKIAIFTLITSFSSDSNVFLYFVKIETRTLVKPHEIYNRKLQY